MAHGLPFSSTIQMIELFQAVSNFNPKIRETKKRRVLHVLGSKKSSVAKRRGSQYWATDSFLARRRWSAREPPDWSPSVIAAVSVAAVGTTREPWVSVAPAVYVWK